MPIKKQYRLRNEKILSLYNNEEYTYKELGKIYGISKQRVGQILAKVRLDKDLTRVL